MEKYYESARKEWLAHPRTVAGIMTGTSLDGIDSAIATFSQGTNGHKLTVLSTQFSDYPDLIRDTISAVIEKKRPVAEIAALNVDLATLYDSSVRACCAAAGLPVSSLDAVGIHGQTVWHNPPASRRDKKRISTTPSTLQLGSGSALSQLLGVPVVSDFRTADVAAGGQGAPLVPIFDKEFFSREHESVGILNIGGISNITFLPQRGSDTPVLAFDTGPGNMLIDAATRLFFGKIFDESGRIANAGVTIPGILQRCMEHEFIGRQPPKSTGREMYGKAFLESILGSIRLPSTPGEDIVRTMTEFTAASIARNVSLFGGNIRLIVASGGGIRNATLMNLLAQRLSNVELTTTDEAIGLPSDFKEALCFAYLAYRALGGLPGNIPSVTGASRACVLGSVSYP